MSPTETAGDDARPDDEGDWATPDDEGGQAASDSKGGWAAPDDTVADPRDGFGRRHALGFALLVAGVGLFVVPGGPSVLVTDNRLFVAVAATATLILGLFYAADRRVTSGRRWQPRDPEPGTEVPLPGESFERLPERELRERIRTRAIVSLTDATRWSRDEAERRLDDGIWTADRLAAAALGADVAPPLRSRLRAWLTRADLAERARERAMAELAAIRAGNRRFGRTDDEAGPPPSPDPDRVEGPQS